MSVGRQGRGGGRGLDGFVGVWRSVPWDCGFELLSVQSVKVLV